MVQPVGGKVVGQAGAQHAIPSRVDLIEGVAEYLQECAKAVAELFQHDGGRTLLEHRSGGDGYEDPRRIRHRV